MAKVALRKRLLRALRVVALVTLGAVVFRLFGVHGLVISVLAYALGVLDGVDVGLETKERGLRDVQ